MRRGIVLRAAWIKEPSLDPRRLISALTKYQATHPDLKPVCEVEVVQ
jgi:hypothetical protein